MTDHDMVALPPPAELSMSVGEALFTQRAIRRFDPDRPISDADLRTIIDAGSKAPNGGNVQPVRLLVIRDRERIATFGELYHEAWWAKRADAYGWVPDQELPEGSPYAMPALLANEIGAAPVVLLVFSHRAPGVSVFPTAQNLMIAARALGIGSVLTTLHDTVLERLYEMFAVPAEMRFHCCIPMGYPRGNFGTTRRRPTSETTFWNNWGERPPWGP
ncbi:MAG: nitroreductase family protein [Acidimicrobiales bacterium]